MRRAAFLALAGCSPEVAPTNLAPHADAGPDLAVPADAEVSVDGRGSTDPEGDVLEFAWSFDTVPPGSGLADALAAFVPNGDTSGHTAFVPDKVGVYVVRLVTWDGQDASAPDVVLIDVGPPEHLPIANAGDDVVAAVSELVHLDGGGSTDPNGGDLAFAWTLVDAPASSTLDATSLAGADSASPSFTPDAIGDYTVALVVTGPLATSLPDATRVRVVGDDDPPVSDAGDDQVAPECAYVALTCDGTDREGAPLAFAWNVEGVPDGSAATRASFGDAEAGVTTFLPDVRGTYALSCSAWDGAQWSLPDAVAVEVTARVANERPVVDAGHDRDLSARPEAVCHPVESGWQCDECPAFLVDLGIDGSITDPDNDPFTVAWTTVEDPDGVANGHAILDDGVFPSTGRIPAIRPRFPGSCEDRAYKFRVTATDCPGDSARDTVTITAHCCGTL